MRAGEPSRTAEFMAVFRASETARADDQRLVADPLAAVLLPERLRWAAHMFAIPPIGALLNRYIDYRWPGARTSGIARTRLIDNWIEGLRPGIDQVILLGAGFDTRAWRLSSLASARVFEVDHPNTAAVKQARLKSAGVDLDRVSFVPVDFEKDNFDAELCVAGFDRARPAIVVWEGVSQYLHAPAVCDVLCWAGGLAAGSRFIFTYIHQGVLDGSVSFAGAEAAISAVNASGEPWKFGLRPERLASFLKEKGLELISDLGADQYRAKVMGPASHTIEGYGFYHTALAEVVHA